MKIRTGITLLFLIALSGLAAKIYYHNQRIHLLYARQRLERTQATLRAQINKLLITYYTTFRFDRVNHWARSTHGLQPLRLSALTTLDSALTTTQAQT